MKMSAGTELPEQLNEFIKFLSMKFIAAAQQQFTCQFHLHISIGSI